MDCSPDYVALAGPARPSGPSLLRSTLFLAGLTSISLFGALGLLARNLAQSFTAFAANRPKIFTASPISSGTHAPHAEHAHIERSVIEPAPPAALQMIVPAHPSSSPSSFLLSRLVIRNLAIIDHSEVELGPGLIVVTGETGAGKSMMVGALRLILGERGRPDMVRAGVTEAEVEALFELPDAVLAQQRLHGLGLGDEHETELFIRRVVSTNGKSRVYVNGRLSTATQAASILDGLVDISSQHQHHSLADATSHLYFLDSFAGLEPTRARMAQLHGKLEKSYHLIVINFTTGKGVRLALAWICLCCVMLVISHYRYKLYGKLEKVCGWPRPGYVVV
eukprot:g37295.t1